jgi:hypothetical protein
MRVTLVCGLLLVLGLPARAQPDALPAVPVPVAPGGPLTYQPPPPGVPDVPPSGPFESGPVPAGPTLGDGWYIDAEAAILFPTVRGHASPPFSVPFQSLNTTISPTFELGYRLPESQGYFIGTYRFLNADGTGTAFANDGTQFSVRSHLSVQSFALDYGSVPEAFERYTFSWRLGARVDALYFDSRATNGVDTLQASNYFFGGGPHARAEVTRSIGMVPGLSVFGRLDGTVLVGHVQQRFHDEAAGFLVTIRDFRTVPVVQAQLGLSYVPTWLPGLRISSGYEFEEYFAVGTLGFGPNGSDVTSRGEAYWHGLFVRAQYDF